MLALLQLARAALTRVGLTGRISGVRPLAVGVAGGVAGSLIPGLFGGGDGATRRRRRRRVLTANDRADIAFITATLGAPAGKSFALIVAART